MPFKYINVFIFLYNLWSIQTVFHLNCFFPTILDRHQVWRSHDPTSEDFWLLWEKKKGLTPPFFKKDATFCPSHLFVICIFFSFKETQFLFIHIILFIHPVICRPPVIHLVVISPVIHQVIWCFPILLTTSLSYPMAIFSANEIRTFKIESILLSIGNQKINAP